MNTDLILQISSTSSTNTELIGQQIGANLKGGEVIELASDLGGGKTTLTRGIAKGAGSKDDVASPTFTLTRQYKVPNFVIHHFDFYRLSEPGILAHELQELQANKADVIIVEWGDIVADILPTKCLRIQIAYGPSEQTRNLKITVPKELDYLLKGVNK